MPMFKVAIAVVCVTALFVLPAGAAPDRHAFGKTRVLVLLSGSPVASGDRFQDRSIFTHSRLHFDPSLPVARDYTTALRRYQDRQIAFLRHLQFQIEVKRRFQTVLNGFGATVPTSELARLARAPNVKAVVPERRFQSLLDRSVQLVRAPEAWARLGGASHAGRGVYIANIDSGIDITNPCFKDAGFARPAYGLRTDSPGNRRFINNKVVVARAFGDDANKRYSAEDTQGHGTFTAAIAACDANTRTPLGTRISGVAPGAYLMNYNVFPAGSTGPFDDQVIAAIDAALLDAADVANLSLGSAQGTGDVRLDPEAAAVQSAVRAGLTVVVAAGNAGPTRQSISSPGDAPDAITVGAVSNSHGIYSSVSITGPGTVPPALQSVRARQGSFAWGRTVGPARLVDVGLGRKPSDDPKHPGANDFAGKHVRGRIALIERGNGGGTSLLLVKTKIANAQTAGAAGVVLYDDRVEPSLPTVDQAASRLPVSLVSQKDGRAILSWRRSHARATLVMRSSLSTFEENPGVVTDFSSTGYGADYAIKPDLVAPGQDIYAATQSHVRSGDMYDATGFTSQSGTSFAAPHVAGAAALVRQRHPTWTALMVKASLLDTARSDVSLPPQSSGPPPVVDVGSGLLDASAAIESAAYLTPTQVSFGQVNPSSATVQRRLSLVLHDAGTGAGPWQVRLHPLHGASLLTLTPSSTVNLPVNGEATIGVQLSANQVTAAGEYDGYVEVSGAGVVLHVPYFIRVVHQSVSPGSVLLVDATASRLLSGSGTATHSDGRVAPYYERALAATQTTYSYWNEALLGTPSVDDMRHAQAVMYFTGQNLNGYGPENADPDAVLPPLDPLDLGNIRRYLGVGGHVLLSGVGASLSDPYWLAIEMGATRVDPSIFGQSSSALGGARRSPGELIAIPDLGGAAHSGIFSGLRSFDLSMTGDGVHDNGPVYSPVAGSIGVPGLRAAQGMVGSGVTAYGRVALRAATNHVSAGVATTSSDEPSLSRTRQFGGRAVFLGFGFESINTRAGHAGRVEAMKRLLQWFNDSPRAFVDTRRAAAGVPFALHAHLVSNVGTRAVQYSWQLGGRYLPGGSPRRTVTVGRPGQYRLRVRIVDALGHAAVSSWAQLTVR
ncbi:MAG: hypothetical protein NVS4B2_15010 [Chloroflexota bacterium]